jgi:hypothetical protein
MNKKDEWFVPVEGVDFRKLPTVTFVVMDAPAELCKDLTELYERHVKGKGLKFDFSFSRDVKNDFDETQEEA